jgi:hypothetical protein
VAVLTLAATAIVVAGMFSGWYGYHPIDWGNYMQAASRMLAGGSPYQDLEFFAPAWVAIALIPLQLLPAGFSSGVWLLLSAAAAFSSALIWTRYQGYPASPRARVLLSALTAASPAALYVYVTGQITALAELALVGLAVLATSKNRKGILIPAVVASLLVTSKPHVVVLPLLLILLESVRARAWKLPVTFAATIFIATIASWIVRPGWPGEWISALQAGQYLGGPGLAARGYFGLREAGVPGILLFLPAGYTFLHWRSHGLKPPTLALAIAAGLTAIPYVRPYDLLLPWPCAITAAALWRAKGQRVLSVVSLLAVAVLPLTNAALLLPPLVTGLILGCLSLRQTGKEQFRREQAG